jgi:hypothetical protein
LNIPLDISKRLNDPDLQKSSPTRKIRIAYIDLDKDSIYYSDVIRKVFTTLPTKNTSHFYIPNIEFVKYDSSVRDIDLIFIFIYIYSPKIFFTNIINEYPDIENLLKKYPKKVGAICSRPVLDRTYKLLDSDYDSRFGMFEHIIFDNRSKTSYSNERLIHYNQENTHNYKAFSIIKLFINSVH